MKSFVLKNYKRIEFWIVLFFLIRLVGIVNPPLEISHNWRQTTGLMVARNFLEVDPSIFYARIDDNSGGPGIIGIEFPSLNYIHFILAKVFGYTHWYGRLINLIVSSIGLLYFYKLLKQCKFDERLAFFSTLFLATSIWFTFSRKTMPDTYCISIMFVGLYYGLKYLEERKLSQIIAYTLICSLAILSKIPAGIYFIVLLPFVLNGQFSLKSRIALVFASFIPIGLMYAWYFVWNPIVSEKYGIWYNSGVSISEGFHEISMHLGETFDNFYFDAFFSFVTFALFLLGLVLLFVKREKRLILAFVLVFSVFLIYIFKSGYFFYHHNYYIIPFVPVMALVAGYGLLQIKNKWAFGILFFFCVVESIANQQHDFFIKQSQMYKMDLEGIMDRFSSRKDLIVLNGNLNPQLVYLSHRKGWNCNDNQLFDNNYLLELKKSNCKFIVVDKHASEQVSALKLPYSTVFENADFLICRLN